MDVKQGDMVVTRRGRVGLLMDWTLEMSGVQFVNNGTEYRYATCTLRRATMAEIEAAGLHGVGCNQADDWKITC